VKTVRNVTLELLRHGPPHNQLLSPLTQYLALCGNHPAVSVRVPQEHAQFLARLEDLSYRTIPKTREMQLEETARLMAELLSDVPGLAADMPVIERRHGQDQLECLTHLEVVLSASELALLPFELANAPNGFPGAGQPLLLQAQNPLCMTRRVRRIEDQSGQWAERPRILMIAAAPPTVGSIPLQAHVNALTKAVDSWVRRELSVDAPVQESVDPLSGVRLGQYESQYRDVLRILPAADVRQIQRTCARERFTHIHVLAHGKTYTQGVDERFGIALHHPDDPSREDVVGGRRLATLFRSFNDWGGLENMVPNVVTLACCEGGQQGTVMGAGSSLAHTLHEAGIPLVVASQFPLSFMGSVIMTQILYHGLVRGYDPRVLLAKLRRELKSSAPDSHDWASIVAYASFPPTFVDQLKDLRLLQARESVDIAIGEFNTLLSVSTSRESQKQDLEQSQTRLAKAKERLRRVVEEQVGEARGECLARFAATEKRQAEVESMLTATSDGKRTTSDRMLGLLNQAQRNYLKAFATDRSLTWALVQGVSLDITMHGGKAAVDMWTLALLLSEQERLAQHGSELNQVLANLIDLYILGIPLRGQAGVPKPSECADRATALAQELNRRECDARFWRAIKGNLRRLYDWYPHHFSHLTDTSIGIGKLSIAELARTINEEIWTRSLDEVH